MRSAMARAESSLEKELKTAERRWSPNSSWAALADSRMPSEAKTTTSPGTRSRMDSSYCVPGSKPRGMPSRRTDKSEEHTSELQSRLHLVCRLLLEKKKKHRE